MSNGLTHRFWWFSVVFSVKSQTFSGLLPFQHLYSTEQRARSLNLKVEIDCTELMLSDQTYAAPCTALRFILGATQGRRALKNRRLPLVDLVRAFSALVEGYKRRSLFAQERTLPEDRFSHQIFLPRNWYIEVKIALESSSG
jgi:hypothetical protein